MSHLDEICAICGGRYGLHNHMNQRCPKDPNAHQDHTEYRDTVFLAAAANQPQPNESIEDREGAGKILYPLELQLIIIEYKAWLESMIPHVKKSLHQQINKQIEDLKKYEFAAANQEQRGDEEELWNKVIAKVAAADLMVKVKPGDNDALNRWKAEVMSDLKSTYKISKR